MAMEKLILRSVMYGVDKIPDSWFEKVPGGFYKASQKANDKASEKLDGDGGGKKHRRYSHHGDDRRRDRRDRYEDEIRTDDKRRRERRGRSSYDGSHDDDLSRDDRRGAREGGRRRRHYSADGDRYGRDDGYSRASTNAYYSDHKHHGGRQSRPADPYFDERQRPVTSDSSRGTNSSTSKAAAVIGTGFAGAAAAETGAPYPQSGRSSTFPASMPSPSIKPAQSTSTTRPQSSSTASDYMPFAHIYGQPGSEPHPTFAPPPTSASGPKQTGIPSQPLTMPTASPQSYQQNPFAQQATVAAGARPGMQYPGHRVFSPQPTAPNSARAFAGYGNQPPYPDSPRPGRATDRYSPSYASHDRPHSDVRRARSEGRADTSDKGGRYQGKALYVDPQASLRGQVNIPPPPPGPPPTKNKDPRRDSAHEREGHRHDNKANDRGYTSD